MPTAVRPELEPGKVYRTRDLSRWGANPTRLAQRLVREGGLVRLGQGLYAHLRTSRFGVVPPTDGEIVRAFLDGGPFVFTGPPAWNALGLGATAMFAVPLVYNTKRSGPFLFGGRRFEFRRVAFPDEPPVEWFVVDLFEHADQAGVARQELAAALGRAVAHGAFDRLRLEEMAQRYGTKRTQALIEAALKAARS